MVWSWWFCDTITGVKQLQVEPFGGSWSRLLNSAESGSHDFPLGDRRLSRDAWRALTTPWARTLVQCWDGVPVYAGLVTGRPYDRDKQQLTVRHTDFRAILKARYPFGVSAYWADEANGIPGKLVIEGKSLVAAAAKVVEQGMLGPSYASASYALPVVLPSTGTAGSFTRTFENFNLRTVSDVLDELQSTEGGPDIEFAPRWSSSGTLEWVMRAGALTGGLFEWHLGVSKAIPSSVQVEEDALTQWTGVMGVGQGSGADMIIGGTPGAPAAAIPARDTVVKWSDVPTHTQAAALAREELAAHKDPTVQPAVKVRASQVSPSDLVLGSTVRLFEQDDPWMPDGWTTRRLIGVAGGVGEELTLTVQEVR